MPEGSGGMRSVGRPREYRGHPQDHDGGRIQMAQAGGKGGRPCKDLHELSNRSDTAALVKPTWQTPVPVVFLSRSGMPKAPPCSGQSLTGTKKTHASPSRESRSSPGYPMSTSARNRSLSRSAARNDDVEGISAASS